MNVEIDTDLKNVLEFMQRNTPTHKLIGVADALPKIAGLLWIRHEQEPIVAITMRETRLISTEFALGPDGVGGDSGAEACGPAQ
jgi:hypothetical protein